MGTLFIPPRKDRVYTNKKEDASHLCNVESMNMEYRARDGPAMYLACSESNKLLKNTGFRYGIIKDNCEWGMYIHSKLCV